MWQPKTPVRSDNLSFEDMMSRFKSQSEEKMADLDHETNNRRGGGYAPPQPPRPLSHRIGWDHKEHRQACPRSDRSVFSGLNRKELPCPQNLN